ncbi:MAG: AAA family ATPase [Methylocella sp.]
MIRFGWEFAHECPARFLHRPVPGPDGRGLVYRFDSGRIAPGAPMSPSRLKFILEPFDAIRFDISEEWFVKKLIPRQGVAVIYGKSQSFKSFVALDLAMSIALGRDWAGRRVEQAPVVYIAAEGAAGLRKRIAGFKKANPGILPTAIPFSMIAAAPNLGGEKGDLERLVADIESAGVSPGLITIDTLAQSLGGGEENGSGMVQLLSNATALANYFKALVLITHHVGLADDQRMRGHSSLIGGIDAQLLCERAEKELWTTLTLQKLKDEDTNIRLEAKLSRIVIGRDSDGDDISTLVVDRLDDTETAKVRDTSKAISPAQRLLMDVTYIALDEAGKDIRPFNDGPTVRAVNDEEIRKRLYARIAEQAGPDDPEKLKERQRKSFNRSIEDMLKRKILVARQAEGQRFIWLNS